MLFNLLTKSSFMKFMTNNTEGLFYVLLLGLFASLLLIKYSLMYRYTDEKVFLERYRKVARPMRIVINGLAVLFVVGLIYSFTERYPCVSYYEYRGETEGCRSHSDTLAPWVAKIGYLRKAAENAGDIIFYPTVFLSGVAVTGAVLGALYFALKGLIWLVVTILAGAYKLFWV